MRTLLVCILSFFSLSTYAAKAKVTNVDFTDLGREGKIIITLDKDTNDFPEVSVKKDFVQVALPGSFVWPKIEKKFTFQRAFDSKLMAYQFNKDLVRVRAYIPGNVERLTDKTSMVLKGNKVIVSFPKKKSDVAVSPVQRKPAVVKEERITAKPSADKYDESYLDKLLKEKEQAIEVDAKKPIKLGQSNDTGAKEDSVNVALAAPKKEEGSFNLMSYIGKFVGFLALVLLLFYGVVTLLKKGAFKKGKLGFLNSTKIVEVLNTTYIGPKRSLLLIRAHKQVFLVGSSEKGLHMISELNDMNGLFKEGEKQISGSNFDSTLGSANETNKEFKLKDFLEHEVSEESHLGKTQEGSSIALQAIEKEMKAAKNSHKAKFSDQIKNKMKDLKPLQ